jgi:ATP-dependent DNA helicase RecQ
LQHPALYERLRALRAEIAKKQSVPAFVVFTDATLREMCAQLPQDEPALLRVSGMGEKKMRRYGARFLEAICDYVAQKGAS